jgi:hypothetical protein
VQDVVAKLVAEGLLDAEAAHQVTDAVEHGKSLDDALHAAPGIAEEKILRFFAAYFDVPFVDLDEDAA